MQKKIIALAIAAAVSAPAFAESNVTVYGQANVSYDLTNTGAVSANKVSSNASRLGFKGNEDLGDGLSAVWQVEQLVAIDNSGAAGNGLATRNTFAGLSSGNVGTLILGRHDTPYKIATRGLDLFADSIADNRSLMGTTAGGGFAGVHDARLTDVVAYISPAMSGFTGAIAYVAGAEAAAAGAGSVKGSAWSMAGMYNNGPINASLSYQTIKVGTAASGTMGAGATTGGVTLGAPLAAGDKVNAWKLGGGYTMDAFTVNAAYEKTSNTIGNVSAGGQTNWYLAGKYSFGNDAVKLAYTHAGSVENVVNSAAKQWALGYDHNLSKRTSLYALYTQITNDAAAAYGLSSAGVATGTTAAGAAPNNDPHAWSFGMKHSF